MERMNREVFHPMGFDLHSGVGEGGPDPFSDKHAYDSIRLLKKPR